MNPASPRLIVIICTHNPREAGLRETLQALRDQTVPAAGWDLLVIDNSSRTPLTDWLDLSWHPRARILREERLGTAYARLTALREASAAGAELVLFVDDDNILAADYVAVGLELADAWPQLGCWGGQLLPRYEAEPPVWLENFKNLLAIHPLAAPVWSNQVHTYDTVPPTAGCFLRRPVWLHYLQLVEDNPLRLTLGARGQDQVRGEDTDLVLSAIDLGLGLARFPRLSLEHIIPAGRLTVAYVENLIAGVNVGITVLEYIRYGRIPEPIGPNWLARMLVKSRARRLPEPMRTFCQAELRGREKAGQMIREWERRAPAPDKPEPLFATPA